MLDDKEIKERLEKFASNRQSEHSVNVSDFKYSKNMAAGNGFANYIGSLVWHKKRSKVNASGIAMTPIVNSIVYKFTENPFDFKADDSIYDIDWSELKFQLGDALRDAVQDGIGYILTYKKDDKIRFARLNNFNMIYGECEYSNGKDAKEAVYIDKKKTDRKQHGKGHLSVAFENVLKLNPDEIPVLTYYFIEDGECHQVKIEGDDIAEYIVQPIGKIPIARIYGKEVPIDFRKNWRGLYYTVKDVLMTMDIEQSVILERIAMAPNHQYDIAEESIGNNAAQYEKTAGEPTAYRTYKATNTNNPSVNLPPPRERI
jgi:hypothetical protein